MQVEFNKSMLKAGNTYQHGNTILMLTPPIDENYWLFRVHLHKDQYVQAFPKFTTLGIGFAIEDEDWNTNLPFSVSPEDLYNHISCNKKYDEITKEQTIEAIKLLAAACADYKSQTSKN